MADTKFIAILPTTLQAGDKIFIKGTLIDDPNEFSINFANETCCAPTNITYHMKWFVNENKLVENFKMDGDWIDHKESYINSLDGRFSMHEQKENHNYTNHSDDELANINNNINNNKNNTTNILDSKSTNFSLVGNQFELEYVFQTDINEVQSIYVYGINEYGSSMISSYELNDDFQFNDIKSLQVWGDTAKVNQLSFIYN